MFTALLGSTAASAQDTTEESPPDKVVEESSTGSYIVVLEAEPVVAEVGAENLDTPAADAASAELEESHDEVLTDAGLDVDEKVQDYTIALNGFSALLSHEEALKVSKDDAVVAVVPDDLYQITTDSSRDFLGLTGPGRAYEAGFTGKGVVVGVIDTGIWPEHPSFADNGMPAPPVTLEDTPDNPACNFGDTAHNPGDTPFTCNNKLIGARHMMATYTIATGLQDYEFNSARDDNGHGSHTASTAAGDSDVPASIFGRQLGVVGGIAPDAHIIAYKALGEQGGYTSDLVSAIDQAVADGVDVINYSIGGGTGFGADVLSFLFAADAGVSASVSAGNDGPNPYTLGGPADMPWVTSVAASTQKRFFAAELTLGNGATYSGASITDGVGEAPLIDAADAGNELCTADIGLDPALVAGKIVLCKRGAVARAEKGRTVLDAGGVGMVLYEAIPGGDQMTDNHWLPVVHLTNADGLEVKDYIASAASPTASISDGGIVTELGTAPSMASFSSRGPNPTSEDIIKPDVTAPGVQILAAASPVTEPGFRGGELFQSIAGTSMSAPHVAGVMALIVQAHPDWSPAMVKSALMTQANPYVRDNDLTTMADPFDMGAGHINPGRGKTQGSTFNPGIVYDADLNDYAAYLCGTDAGIVSAGFCNALGGAGYSFDASDLNLPSIGVAELAGSQTVTRTITSVAYRTIRWNATVKAPKGFKVEVSPARATLAPGESLTYTTTITSTNRARLNQWSFGSVTWSGDAYDARVPMAVRAVPVAAPALVTGTGAAGSGTFDVTFGYSGAYTARGHGLIAAEPIEGTVVQDPDQSFNPGDGFSQIHEIDVSDAAYLRIAFPPDSTEANADLDLFLFDPDGNLAAQSTSGGTDEQIDIPEPVDGTWTLYVHGWLTIGPDSDYSGSLWVVPGAPDGGTLTVTSAPATATNNTTGTVGYAWTGADIPGHDYLGAISHSNADGIQAYTIVDVTG